MIDAPAAVTGRLPPRAGWPLRGLVLGTAGAGLGVAAHAGAAGHGLSPFGAALAFGTATCAGMLPARRRGGLATAVSAAVTQVVAHTVLHLGGHRMAAGGSAAEHPGMPSMTGMSDMTGMQGMTGSPASGMHHAGMHPTGAMHHAMALPGSAARGGLGDAVHGGLGDAVRLVVDSLGLSGMLLGHVLAAVLAALVLTLAEATLAAAVVAGAWVRTWWAALSCPPLVVPALRLVAPVDPDPARLPAAPGRPGQVQRRGPPQGARLAVA